MTHSSAPTMRQVVLHSCVTVLALMLSACGGGSGIAIPTQQGSSLPTSTSAPNATAQVFNAADYIFPYQVGDHRVFIDLDPRNPDSALYPSFMDIKSSATVDGQTGWVVSATGPATYFVAINSDTIRTFGMRTDIGELSRPLETYPTVLHLGDQFVVNRLSWTETDQLSGNQVEATLTTISTVVSVEDITTRLGPFKQCLKLLNQDVLTHIVEGKDVPVTGVPNDSWSWFCKGIGQVRWMRSDGSFSREMAAYDIGGMKNETVPAEATLTGTPTADQHWKLDTLRVTFNEPMQASTLNATSVVVTDSQHRVIDGEYATGPNWVTFKPHMGAMTEDGDYQLVVTSGAKDWAGNGAALKSWTFRADGHPPIPVSTIPANQSTGVPTNQIIQINFGEPVRMDYMPSDVAVIDLTVGPNAIVLASAKFESGKILIQPNLQAGHTYRLYLVGQVFYDLADNIWQDPLDVTFSTAP